VKLCTDEKFGLADYPANPGEVLRVPRREHIGDYDAVNLELGSVGYEKSEIHHEIANIKCEQVARRFGYAYVNDYMGRSSNPEVTYSRWQLKI
jgi:hypothetical protein